MLISSDGVLAGVMGAEGRALSSPRGAGFAAESWLADDGDLANPKAASARAGFDGPRTARTFQVLGIKGIVLSGKDALAKVDAACASADLVLMPVRLGPSGDHPAGCTVIDAAYLAQSGAIAGVSQGDGLLLLPVRAEARVWNGNDIPVSPLFVRPGSARTGPSLLALGGGS